PSPVPCKLIPTVKKRLILNIQRRGDKTAHGHLRAAADYHALRVDQKHVAVRPKTSENLARAPTHHTVEHHLLTRLLKSDLAIGSDRKRIPPDHGSVGLLFDRQGASVRRVGNLSLAVDKRSAARQSRQRRTSRCLRRNEPAQHPHHRLSNRPDPCHLRSASSPLPGSPYRQSGERRAAARASLALPAIPHVPPDTTSAAGRSQRYRVPDLSFHAVAPGSRHAYPGSGRCPHIRTSASDWHALDLYCRSVHKRAPAHPRQAQSPAR